MKLIDADAIRYDQLLNIGNKEHPLEWAVSRPLIDSMPTIEAIPIKWIEKQKALRCYPRSISWLVLEALLKTWKEEKDEVEE